MLLGVCLGSLIFLAAESCATAAVAPTLQCEAISAGRTDRIGTDRFGYLWLWDQGASTVRWLDPDGEMLDVIEIPESHSVDADQGWGVASVGQLDGATLRILRPGQSEPALLILPEEVSGIAWINRDRVAVAPTRADSLVEIWDLAERRQVRSLGQGHRIEASPGATFGRALVLQPGPEGKHLYTLDSLRGDLRVFSLDGEPTLEAKVEAHKLPELEEWLRDVDREARGRGMVQIPLYHILELEVDGDGSAQVVERCSEDRTRASWVRVSPNGEIERGDLQLTAPVCSHKFARWNGEWVFVSTVDGEVSRPFLCKRVPIGESP